MELHEAVAEVVKKLRKEHKISQERLAQLIGSHQVYISEIEQGKKLASLTVLKNIANSFDMTLTEFIHQVENKL